MDLVYSATHAYNTRMGLCDTKCGTCSISGSGQFIHVLPTIHLLHLTSDVCFKYPVPDTRSVVHYVYTLGLYAIQAVRYYMRYRIYITRAYLSSYCSTDPVLGTEYILRHPSSSSTASIRCGNLTIPTPFTYIPLACSPNRYFKNPVPDLYMCVTPPYYVHI